MACAVSGFAIYCGYIFKNEDVFDPLALDRRGGFRSVANIGMWSSIIMAIVPAVALPNLIMSMQTYSEMVFGLGSLIWLIFVINFFFFTPQYYLHGAMRTSKEIEIKKFEDIYRKKFHNFINCVKKENSIEQYEISSMIALKQIYDHLISLKVWPVDYSTIIRILISSILPLISYFINYLL